MKWTPSQDRRGSQEVGESFRQTETSSAEVVRARKKGIEREDEIIIIVDYERLGGSTYIAY